MQTFPVPSEIISFLKAYKHFYIAVHVEPDGDCIGSALALSLFLNGLGKTTHLFSEGPFIRTEIEPYKYLFKTTCNRESMKFDGSEGALVLDCSTKERIGSISEVISGLPGAVIDHHSSGKPFGDIQFIRPNAPSTTFLIQLIIEKMNNSVTKDEAAFLLFGLLTDTGYFRHLAEGTGEIFRSVGRLVDAGANPHEIHHMIYGGKSYESRKLLGTLLSRCEDYYGGKLMVTWETLEDINEFGKESRDSDTLYQLLFSIKGSKTAVLLREEGNDEITCSLRSRKPIDVGTVAAEFGGGGHKLASGFSLQDTSLSNVKAQIINRFKELLM